jgi:RimJ/RimL family protein N-acetyltransferase
MASQARIEYDRKYRASPKGQYAKHKENAKRRGVPFHLTFEQWWTLWKPHWERRGKGGLVMCRKGDSGPYAVGNVYIESQSHNACTRNTLAAHRRWQLHEAAEHEAANAAGCTFD